MISIPKRFRKMEAGDYICRIIKAEIAPNKYQEPCLWLSLDIAFGKYEGYFATIYQNRLNRGVDVYPCIYSQNMSNYSIRFFKQLLKSIINSNPNYVCTCEDGKEWNEQELVGLLVGVTFEEHKFTNARGRQQINLIPMRFKEISLIQEEENSVEEQIDNQEKTNNEEINNDSTEVETAEDSE